MIDIYKYDDNNVFAKILRNQIPCKKVYEDKICLAFEDINPKAPVHVLVIPKIKACSFNDFIDKSDENSIALFYKSLRKITKLLNLEKGYRLICNVGEDGGQEVPHLHFHILGKKRLSGLIP